MAMSPVQIPKSNINVCISITELATIATIVSGFLLFERQTSESKSIEPIDTIRRTNLEYKKGLCAHISENDKNNIKPVYLNSIYSVELKLK
jgi:hypothetical protein